MQPFSGGSSGRCSNTVAVVEDTAVVYSACAGVDDIKPQHLLQATMLLCLVLHSGRQIKKRQERW